MKADSAIFGTALFCTLFGFGAGVFFTIHEYVVFVIFLVLAVGTWLGTRYALHHATPS